MVHERAKISFKLNCDKNTVIFFINLLLIIKLIYTQFYKFSGRVKGKVMAKAGDRLWLDMCQLMIWQEQIKRWVCLAQMHSRSMIPNQKRAP